MEKSYQSISDNKSVSGENRKDKNNIENPNDIGGNLVITDRGDNNQLVIQPKINNDEDDYSDYEEESPFSKAVFLAEFCLENSRLEDAMRYSDEAIMSAEAELKEHEREVLVSSYRSFISEKRNALRQLISLDESDKKTNSADFKLISEVRSHLEKIVFDACEKFIILINKYIISKTVTHEGKAFFLKIKADNYRYLADISVGDSLITYRQNSLQFYKESIKYSELLNPLNPIRLGTYLNFAVFCYEILSNPLLSVNYASEAFNAGLDELKTHNEDYLDDPHNRDSLSILQVIKENITEWYNEIDR